LQVERAVLDLCLDPSDSYLAAVAVDISSIENNVSSSVRLYEVGRQRPAAGDDDDDSDGAADEVRCSAEFLLFKSLIALSRRMCCTCAGTCAVSLCTGRGLQLAMMAMIQTVQLMR
jgi:hypothetical protein